MDKTKFLAPFCNRKFHFAIVMSDERGDVLRYTRFYIRTERKVKRLLSAKRVCRW